MRVSGQDALVVVAEDGVAREPALELAISFHVVILRRELVSIDGAVASP